MANPYKSDYSPIETNFSYDNVVRKGITFTSPSVKSFQAYSQPNPNFYLHANGVTCMCPNAAIGETGDVNGITYTKRTKEQITTFNVCKHVQVELQT